MTNEEIKQNALKCADDFIADATFKRYIRDTYIAGAHSRDEEIKELKEEIESLKEQYNSCFDGFSKRGTKLGELIKENVKLSNPWISVEDRIPEEYEIVFVSFGEDKHFKGIGYISDAIDEVWYLERWGHRDDVTHWMSIPELKKGE